MLATGSVGAHSVPNQRDLLLMLLLLLLQFGVLAQLPVQLAAVSEHEVLKIAAQALISVFPAVQYIRCARREAWGWKALCCCQSAPVSHHHHQHCSEWRL
jgi:hypothetical protein